jgi:hypothetical protein
MHKVSAVAQKAPASSASLPRHPALVLFRVEDSGMNSTGHPDLSRSLRVGDTAGPLNYDRGPTFGDGRASASHLIRKERKYLCCA